MLLDSAPGPAAELTAAAWSVSEAATGTGRLSARSRISLLLELALKCPSRRRGLEHWQPEGPALTQSCPCRVTVGESPDSEAFK